MIFKATLKDGTEVEIELNVKSNLDPKELLRKLKYETPKIEFLSGDHTVFLSYIQIITGTTLRILQKWTEREKT